MTVSIISQLQSLYSRRGFREKLNYRRNRGKLVPDNIEDVYDGSVYQQLCAPGQILSEINNISFYWYTDGVQFLILRSFLFDCFILSLMSFHMQNDLERRTLF